MQAMAGCWRALEIRATATFRPKDQDARTVPLSDQFVEFPQRYGLRSPFVLKPEVAQGRFRYRHDFRRPFDDYMAKQGVPWVSPQPMRHSVASICASKGIDIYRIATQPAAHTGWALLMLGKDS